MGEFKGLGCLVQNQHPVLLNKQQNWGHFVGPHWVLMVRTWLASPPGKPSFTISSAVPTNWLGLGEPHKGLTLWAPFPEGNPHSLSPLPGSVLSLPRPPH